MPKSRKRSRSQTEQRFQEAVLDLVGESGFENLGINLVAERAGADKVLIYRYFGDFDGLLRRVAESRAWLPSPESLRPESGRSPEAELGAVFDQLSRHVIRDRACHRIALWRHAVDNPLTRKFAAEWEGLWKQLQRDITRLMPYEQRSKWLRALEMLAMMAHSEITGEPVNKSWIDLLGTDLEPSKAGEEISSTHEDILPTNLL